jgi:hypothetical protein
MKTFEYYGCVLLAQKVTSFSSPPVPKDLLDKLISAVIPEEGDERSLEWSLNDDGVLDLCTE